MGIGPARLGIEKKDGILTRRRPRVRGSPQPLTLLCIHWTSGRRNTSFRDGRDGYAGLTPRRLGIGQGVVRREETGAGPSGGAFPRTRDACRNDRIQPGRMGD